MQTWNVIGVMSGTSLDGLDVALCEFRNSPKWSYKVLKAGTFTYTSAWRQKLSQSIHASGRELVEADKEFGDFIGDKINGFMRSSEIRPDLIASHGHTVFHQPKKGITTQIGDGHAIAVKTKIPVVYNFRSLDVALGGQGAPLVPAGDRHLFGEYDYCLNLGGIANISCENNGTRIAWDICPANMVLNYLANKAGNSFDKNGYMAAKGKTDDKLLEQLNSWNYYNVSPPKSIGREDVEEIIIPLIDKANLPLESKLSTFCDHISLQISKAIKNKGKLLVTGGGALNNHLIARIKKFASVEIEIPDPVVIHFKEAMVFAFLGLLKYTGEINCYASVTGAVKDSSCGVIVLP